MTQGNQGGGPTGATHPGQPPGGMPGAAYPGASYGHPGAIPGRVGGGGGGGSGWITAEAFSAAWGDLQRLGFHGLLPFVFVLLGCFVAQGVWSGITKLVFDTLPFGGIGIPLLIGVVGGGVLSGIGGSTICLMALTTARGGTPSIEAARDSIPYWPAAVVASVITQSVFSLTIAFCGLGVFFAISWSLSLPALVDRKLNGVESLAESWDLSEGRRVDLLIMNSLVLLFLCMGAIPCGLGLVVMAPLCCVGMAHFYLLADAASNPSCPPEPPIWGHYSRE
ncbi:MAG: hypothetical protein HRU17_17715 [Polyangiaceae bacterium]|nr:hypothetical protein [Polyangiaceae bacterium]